MPIYEYLCKTCGHRFEKIQRLNEASPKLCPACGAKAPEKLISRSTVKFVGSGFYETDYARAKPPETSSKKTSEKTAETKPSDSKTADKAAPKTKKAAAS